MFPCLPTSDNIVAETKFASQEAKRNSETFLFRKKIFPQKYFLVYPGLYLEYYHYGTVLLFKIDNMKNDCSIAQEEKEILKKHLRYF